ncbi:MAG: hypothetical protein ACHQ1D_00625 [Nitrososphaerales archaeon]
MVAFAPETEDGWFELLYGLCLKIEELKPDSFEFTQIKEKFGLLRIYFTIMDNSDDKCASIHDLCDAYEEESALVCEMCGSKNEVGQSGSWIKTLCKEHRA